MRDGSDEEIQDTDLNMLLQELVVQFKPLDIRFEPAELPIIQARSLSLKRLIGNLINNSKFSSESQKEASLLCQNIQEFCHIIPNLDDEIMENIEHQKLDFSKISPAIELIAVK